MIKLFEFTFLDIYNKTYIISIYDSEGTTQGNVLTAKLYGQDGFILNYEKENIDIVQGGIIKSDVTFSVVNEGGILDDFLKNLQTYENRYLVDIFYNERLFWRGVMLNDYITFEDSKMQVIDFSCTEGLGLLQNIDYEDSIRKLDSTLMQFDSDAYGNGLIDVISRALSFNPITKFFNFNERYINYRTDYIANEMLNDWDALVYTNILKHKADTTLLVSPFADYAIKETLAGNRLKVYEYKNCYDVINECLKVFNLCLCERYGVWYIFNIRDFEKNKDNFILNAVNFVDNSYYKNIRNKDLKESVVNNYFSIGGNNSNKRGDGEFSLNTVVKKVEQKYVPYYVKEGKFNNLIYSGNHGGDLQWYSYPATVITDAQGSTLYYESNFDNWNLCSKYHYHNELDIFAAMTKLQFLINFYVTYAVNAGGVINVPSMQCKLDLNLKVNGKWLDNNGNWVDNLPADNWWHKFSGTFIGQDGVVNINFKKYFDLLIPSSNENLVVDFYFRIYSHGNLWVVDYIITDIENNSVLKLVDDNGNDIESIDYKVENDTGILDLEIEQAFIDNFGESEENNILFTAVQDLGLNSYRYKKSKKWKHTDEDNFYNLIELRLREIAAMNNHPLLRWDGNIYYDEDTEVNYMLFYLIKYNLTLQKYVMFANRWTFYARKKYAEASLIEVSKDFLKVISGNDLAIVDYNVPMVYLDKGIFTDNNGNVTVQANSINLTVNDTVNNVIRLSNESGEIDYIINYDDSKRKITLNNETGALLTIDDNGLYYKNEKGAGNGIEIDINNKINANIDDNTIKIDGNNKLYADVQGFSIDSYLQQKFITYLQNGGFYINLRNNSYYNLLTALSTSLESYFMHYYNDKLNIVLSQLQDYTQLKAYIENNIILDLEHKDSVFITYQDKIYIFNYTDSTFTLIYTQPGSYTISDLYYCKESTYYNALPTLYFIANGTLWNLERGDTSINCTKFIIYNHELFVFYDGTITRYDTSGRGTNEATDVNVDDFFAIMGTIFYWDVTNNKTYNRQNGIWIEYYNNIAVKNIILFETSTTNILVSDINGCILRNKLFVFKSDGIYQFITGEQCKLTYTISGNIIKASCTEDYAYIYTDTNKLYKFDGDILTEIGSYDISEILAVSAKDTKFSIVESEIDDNLQFGNNSQSILLEKYHNDSYGINLCQNNNFYTSLFVKNLVVKSEIKNIGIDLFFNHWAGLKIWLKSDYGVIYDLNNKISQWNDASGNGYIFSQSAPNRQPLYIPSIDSMNNKPAIKFDNSTLTSNQQITIGTFFILTNFDATTFPDHCGLLTRINVIDTYTDFILVSQSGTNFYNSKLLNRILFINDIQTYDFAPLKTPKIVYSYLESPVIWDDIALGYDRSLWSRFWHGDVYEVIIYDRILNQNEIEGVKYYLKTKYNMDF